MVGIGFNNLKRAFLLRGKFLIRAAIKEVRNVEKDEIIYIIFIRIYLVAVSIYFVTLLNITGLLGNKILNFLEAISEFINFIIFF